MNYFYNTIRVIDLNKTAVTNFKIRTFSNYFKFTNCQAIYNYSFRKLKKCSLNKISHTNYIVFEMELLSLYKFTRILMLLCKNIFSI